MTSKQLVQTAIPGWQGRLAAHHVGYLADGHVHRAVPYNATDPKVVAKKLELMQSDGVDIVIETWQGVYAQSCNLDAGLIWAGQIQGLIHDIPTCQELIERIMREATEIITHKLPSLTGANQPKGL